MPDGRLLALDSTFVGGLAAKASAAEPAISREAATGAAAQALGLARRAAFRVVRKLDGAAQAAELSSGGISRSTIPVRLVYEPTRGGVRLAWDVGIEELDARHWWDARVDAATGDLLAKSDNFQESNYGRGGAQNDSIQAEAQDGGGENNATFATPPDGQKPRMQLYLWNITDPKRDAALDSTVIVHEYTHGLSNRLVGGGFGGCLGNAFTPSEGWSDWYALALTALPTDTATTPRGIGTYVVGQTREQAGVRLTPYATDTNVDPATYGSLEALSEVHDVGYVWASMLWEVYWGLVDAHGFNPDLYGDWTTGGNNLAIQLVTDAMKLTPCVPSFEQARDAIIEADQALTGGANTCILWRAFAKRGLGVGADQNSPTNPGDDVEAFDVPSACGTPPATERVSIDSAGREGNGRSDSCAISADGGIVAFQSEASNLVAGDTDGAQDIFVRDRQTGTTEPVSYDDGGDPAGGVLVPAVSADGRFVAFTSSFAGFVPND